LEEDDIRLFIAYKVKAMLIALAYEAVIGIDKLKVSACAYLYASVARLAQTTVGLTYIYNVVYILFKSC
jgi:hypothetical protein